MADRANARLTSARATLRRQRAVALTVTLPRWGSTPSASCRDCPMCVAAARRSARCETASAALGEMRRVLRPGGRLHFVEHGLAPDDRIARWQHRLTPVQRRVAGGCHLDRPILELITGAGLAVDECARYYAGRPKSFTYFYEGRASKT